MHFSLSASVSFAVSVLQQALSLSGCMCPCVGFYSSQPITVHEILYTTTIQ